MKTIDIPTDDPLEMVWAIREKIYEETKDMTDEEWSDYLQKHNDDFDRRIAGIRNKEKNPGK